MRARKPLLDDRVACDPGTGGELVERSAIGHRVTRAVAHQLHDGSALGGEVGGRAVRRQVERLGEAEQHRTLGGRREAEVEACRGDGFTEVSPTRIAAEETDRARRVLRSR